MFAKYLQSALTVEQIGYCERIAESAEQYAQRLLSAKPAVAPRANHIAKELVHTYKDHSFVIDLAEAKEHLGNDWVKENTAEIRAAEDFYSYFARTNRLLEYTNSKRLLILGEIGNEGDIWIWDKHD